MATQQKTEERTRAPQTREQGSRSLQRSSGTGLPFFGPFGLMRRMQEDFDRLFSGVSRGHGSPSSGLLQADWIPTVEAFERGNEFVVRLDLPGLSPDDVTVDVGEDSMTIRGERKVERDEEREGVYVSERSYGTFVRTVPLPSGAIPDNATANFKNGVLEIVVPAPPQEARRGRRLEINKEAEASREKAREQQGRT